jgi:hypothetical protein
MNFATGGIFSTEGKTMNRKLDCFSFQKEQTVASYFGIEVEVLVKLDNCSLIRRGGLKVVVATQDLVSAKSGKQPCAVSA